MKLKTLATALLGGMLTFSSVAAEMTKPEVEKIVREYLISNPEILIEMSNALRAKQEAQQEVIESQNIIDFLKLELRLAIVNI